MRSFGYGHGVVVVTHYYLNNIILFLWFRSDKVYYTGRLTIHVEDIVGVGGCKIGQSMVIINSNLVRYLQRFVFFHFVFLLNNCYLKNGFLNYFAVLLDAVWYKQAFLQTF